MKILHVLKSNIFSGAENVVCTIIQNMPKEYEVYYVSPSGTINEKLKKEGINHIELKHFDMISLRSVFKKYKPDVVHAHDFTASVLSSLLVAKKTKLISHIHHNPIWMKEFNLKTFLFWISSKRFKKILVVSDAVKNDYYFEKKSCCEIQIVGNPFSIEKILEKAHSTDEVNEYEMVYVGRLEDVKNPLLFIDIVEKLVVRFPNIKTALVGSGSLNELCEEQIEKKGLSENIKLLGFQENPYVYMNKSKILCIPSKWEGFGLVALEAMALGKPVVASNVGGLKVLITEECGKLCDDVHDFCKEVICLLSDGSYYESKRKNALKKAGQFDNLKQYCEKMLDIYND